MKRDELLKRIHCLEHEEIIDLGNDFIVKNSFDKVYFMCGGKIYLELDKRLQESFSYEKRLNQFVDYIMQYI